MAASVFFFLGRIFGSICTLLFGELVSKTLGVAVIVLNDYSLIVGFLGITLKAQELKKNLDGRSIYNFVGG